MKRYLVLTVLPLVALTTLASCDDAGMVTCQEDQMAIVRHDTDPHHGLSWKCVDIDAIVQDPATAARLEAARR